VDTLDALDAATLRPTTSRPALSSWTCSTSPASMRGVEVVRVFAVEVDALDARRV
jgi:hypothetical protein